MPGPMSSISRVLGRAAVGAGIGLAGRGAYNALEGKGSEGMGQAAVYGALGFAALGLRQKGAFRNIGNAAKGVYRRAMPNFESRMYAGLNKSEKWMSHLNDIGLTGRNANRANAHLTRMARGYARGGIIGGIAGGVRGYMDDDSSVIGGAFRGALIGAAIGGTRAGWKGRGVATKLTGSINQNALAAKLGNIGGGRLGSIVGGFNKINKKFNAIADAGLDKLSRTKWDWTKNLANSEHLRNYGGRYLMGGAAIGGAGAIYGAGKGIYNTFVPNRRR